MFGSQCSVQSCVCFCTSGVRTLLSWRAAALACVAWRSKHARIWPTRQDKPPYEPPLVPPRGPFPLFQVNPFLQGRRTNFVFAAANKFLICCSLVSYLLFLTPLKLSLRSTFVSPQALSRCTALHCNKETLKKEKAFLSRAVVQLLCIALQLMLCTALHYFALFCTALHAQTCCCYLATATCIRSPLSSLLLLSTIYKE